MEPHPFFRLLIILTVCTLASLLQTPISAASKAVTPSDGDLDKTVPGSSYSYDEESGTGPSAWGDIEGFETCGNGMKQSPIDFPTEVMIRPLSKGPSSNIQSSLFTFAADSNNWAMNCATKLTCGYTVFKGVKYWVRNIHLHTHAEHTLNGEQFPLEAHIVHANLLETKFIVIATMFEYPREGAYGTIIHEVADKEYGANDVLKNILTAVVNDEPSTIIPLGNLVNLQEGTCKYSGSLTTPPCSEGVTFFMQLKPVWVSREQVNTYHLTVGGGPNGNNRPLQPLNNRKVKCFV